MSRYQTIPAADGKRLPVAPVLTVARSMSGVQCNACTAQADIAVTAGWRELKLRHVHGATLRLCSNCAAILNQRIASSISHGP